MNFKVIVSRVPTRMKLGKLVQICSLMFSVPSKDFHVQLMPSEELLREVVISFPTLQDAYLAQEMLDNFVYKDKIGSTVFVATMHSDNLRQQGNTHNPNNQSHEKEGHHRDRSRSPHCPDTSTNLDMQIDIAQKQRMLTEERKKLLEEKKKLDIVKRKSRNTKSSANKSSVETQMPSIHSACEIVMKTMTAFIYKYASAEEHSPLIQHIRSIIKERMAAVVATERHPLPQTQRVMLLYRTEYPPEEDEEFVKAALQEVKKYLSNTPTATVLAILEEANADKVAGDHNNQEGQGTAKDATSPGPTGTKVHRDVSMNITKEKHIPESTVKIISDVNITAKAKDNVESSSVIDKSEKGKGVSANAKKIANEKK